MSIIDKLNLKEKELEFELEKELTYVDRKDREPELKIRLYLARIQGFKLAYSYYNRKDNSSYNGSNSVIEHQRQYNG